MKEIKQYIIGLFSCYQHSKKMTVSCNLNNFLHNTIVEEVENMLESMNQYDKNIVVQRYILGKTMNHISISLNYSSHSSISTKLDTIMDTLIKSQQKKH